MLSFPPSSGVYADELKVELATKRGVVRYTVDGTEPSAQSPAYSKPIPITATTVIKTRLWESSQPRGLFDSQTFVVAGKDLWVSSPAICRW